MSPGFNEIVYERKFLAVFISFIYFVIHFHLVDLFIRLFNYYYFFGNSWMSGWMNERKEGGVKNLYTVTDFPLLDILPLENLPSWTFGTPPPHLSFLHSIIFTEFGNRFINTLGGTAENCKCFNLTYPNQMI